ncbi:ALAAT2 [Scenedesmus sp. PABB004]|nr:ALAAT2 [Scenedesmus sp. PABB004]
MAAPAANGAAAVAAAVVAPPLCEATIKPRVVAADYAVRGEIVRRAQEIEAELEAGKGSYPFTKLVWCNIGNPQLLGQAPITFFRQVLCLCEYPALLDHPAVGGLFPADVVARARLYLSAIPGGVGAYSDSAGALVLRQQIAAALERRDGWPARPDEIYLTDGASPGVHYLVEMLTRSAADAFLVPIPQYPLYSATLTLYGGQLVPYELDEAAGWGLNVDHLKAQLAAAAARGLCVRGLVVINPGNPTGQCLDEANMEAIVAFAAEAGLVLVADEVYQANIYDPARTFVSFKAVLRRLGSSLPLVSLHSTSKGFVGECGRRGGYMEVVNFPADVHAQILKLASINLCPNVSGQICCTLMMTPPGEGDPSYDTYVAERDAVLGSLARRAATLVAGLNRLEGVSCNAAEGALYAFPRITLPAGAVAAAAAAGKPPDWLYASELLEATGIVVVPGSGFGQAPGTLHFRTTFLPPEEDIAAVHAAPAPEQHEQHDRNCAATPPSCRRGGPQRASRQLRKAFVELSATGRDATRARRAAAASGAAASRGRCASAPVPCRPCRRPAASSGARDSSGGAVMAPQLTEEQVFWYERGVLSAEHEDKLARLQAELDGALLPGLDDRLSLLRFLKARHWHPHRAAAMYRAMAAWRREAGVCGVLESYDYAELPAVRAAYPHFYHKTDRWGRPVYIELLGHIDVDRLLKVRRCGAPRRGAQRGAARRDAAGRGAPPRLTPPLRARQVTSIDRFLRYHVQQCEAFRTRKLPACSAAAGRPILTQTIILDMAGLSPGCHFTLTVKRFLETLSQLDQDYFPEHLGALFMINTPFIFRGFWAVIRGFLDERTLAKIKVLGCDYRDELLALIPAENLPTLFGGASPCPELADVGPWQHASLGAGGAVPGAADAVLAKAAAAGRGALDLAADSCDAASAGSLIGTAVALSAGSSSDA